MARLVASPIRPFAYPLKRLPPDGSVDPSGEVALVRYEILRLAAHKGV